MATLSQKAGLANIPLVGVYESSEVNAFAAGAHRNNAFVMFSSALMERMDNEAVAAVAAHEIAHIANGDMLNMSVIRSAVMAMALLIQLPLTLITIFMAHGSDKNSTRDQIINISMIVIQVVVFKVSLFLGNFLALFFSRHREFKADEMAAGLIDNRSMIHALETLSNFASEKHEEEENDERKALAMFKVSSKASFMELFSTHPPLENRVARLREIKQ